MRINPNLAFAAITFMIVFFSSCTVEYRSRHPRHHEHVEIITPGR